MPMIENKSIHIVEGSLPLNIFQVLSDTLLKTKEIPELQQFAERKVADFNNTLDNNPEDKIMLYTLAGLCEQAFRLTGDHYNHNLWQIVRMELYNDISLEYNINLS